LTISLKYLHRIVYISAHQAPAKQERKFINLITKSLQFATSLIKITGKKKREKKTKKSHHQISCNSSHRESTKKEEKVRNLRQGSKKLKEENGR